MNTSGFISFFFLSSHWPQLMEHWQSIESLPIFRNFVRKTAYMRRIRLISSTILVLALGAFSAISIFNCDMNFKLLTDVYFIVTVEHCLFIGITIKSNIMFHSDKDTLMELIRRMVPHLISSTNPPPKYIAITFCYISESVVFVWNFLDIFIMTIGIGLTTHFKALNKELEQTKFDVEVTF